MLTYVISPLGEPDSKMQPFLSCWSAAKRGVLGVPNGGHGKWDKSRDDFQCMCCGSILSLVQIFFSFFVSNSLSRYYHTLPYPKTKEKKI